MSRQHPVPDTSPCLHSVTKDRHSHTIAKMLSLPSTLTLAQLRPSSLTFIVRGRIPHLSFRSQDTTSTAQQYCHGSMSPFSPQEHSSHTSSKKGLCSEAPGKTGLQSSRPLIVHSYSLWWKAAQYNSYFTDQTPQPLRTQTSQALA